MNIGVIGVGTMGSLVVSRLVEANFSVIVYDAYTEAVQQAEALGAVAADSPRAVAGRSEIILLLLPGPPQIEAVVTGEQGILSSVSAGQVIVDMSTVDPETTRRMGGRAKAAGFDYLDAPILGRPSAVGRWVLPVGGNPDVIARCRAVLDVLGRKVVHVGPLGAGNTLKLLNAMMFSAINAMTAEMMAISIKAGLSPQVLFETIAGSDAATVSGLFKEVGTKIIDRDFTPVFPVDLLCKDNGLAIKMARACGSPPILANSIQTMNELARARGLGSEDTSALVKVYETLLDITWDDVEN